MTLKSQNILFATDFSDASQEAFEHAINLAKHNNAVLHLLHVIQTEELIEPGFASNLEEDNEKILNQLAETVSQNGVKVQTHLHAGTPPEIISKTADELNCGLIVLGSHGRTGITRLLMGSTAETVLKKSKLTVIVVKSAAHGSAQ